MSNKIITAEEFFALPDYDKSSIPMFSDIHNAMIEFAKLHVENFTKSGLNLKEYLELHVK